MLWSKGGFRFPRVLVKQAVPNSSKNVVLNFNENFIFNHMRSFRCEFSLWREVTGHLPTTNILTSRYLPNSRKSYAILHLSRSNF